MSNENVFTGITQFDETTGGLKPGELIVIAARVAMGKTGLGLSMLVNEKTTTNFLFISLRESVSELNMRLQRMIGWKTGSGPLTEYDFDNSGRSSYNTEHKRQVIIHLETASLLDIQEAISRTASCYFDAVIIDSLYFIGNEPKQLFRKKTHSQTFRNLKSIARLINKPIILLAEADRIIEKKANKGIPYLKHYSRIKYVDLMFLLYRWEYYLLDWDDSEDRPVKKNEGKLMTLKANRVLKNHNTAVTFDHKHLAFE